MPAGQACSLEGFTAHSIGVAAGGGRTPDAWSERSHAVPVWRLSKAGQWWLPIRSRPALVGEFASVRVVSELPRADRSLVVTLGIVYLLLQSARFEHAQDAEDEVFTLSLG